MQVTGSDSQSGVGKHSISLAKLNVNLVHLKNVNRSTLFVLLSGQDNFWQVGPTVSDLIVDSIFVPDDL